MVYSHKIYFLLVLCVYRVLAMALGPRVTKQLLPDIASLMAERKEQRCPAMQWALEHILKWAICHLGSPSVGQRKSFSHS